MSSLQVDDWLKLGLPYMSEKRWAGYLISVAEGMVTEMTWEQQSAKDAVTEAARELNEVWDKMQEQIDETDQTASVPGLQI